MKNAIRLEELALTIFAFFLFKETGYAWWWFPVWFFAPDLSMLGYLVNRKVGAITYNLLHHRAIAIAFYLFGWVSISPLFAAIGMVLLGHASFDRIFGYGLKYFSGFHDTHLGRIGKAGRPDMP